MVIEQGTNMLDEPIILYNTKDYITGKLISVSIFVWEINFHGGRAFSFLKFQEKFFEISEFRLLRVRVRR